MKFAKIVDGTIYDVKDTMEEGYTPVLTPEEWLTSKNTVQASNGKCFVCIDNVYYRCYVAGIDLSLYV